MSTLHIIGVGRRFSPGTPTLLIWYGHSIECDMPGVEHDPSQAETSFPINIEERLSGIEKSIEALSSLLLDHSAAWQHGETRERPKPAAAPSPTWFTDSGLPRPVQQDGVMRPVLLLRNLQVRLFGPKRDFGDEVLAIGNVVTTGIIGHSIARYLLKV